jgi:fatty acid desaturase
VVAVDMRQQRQAARVEWWTLGVIAIFWGAFGLLTWNWQTLTFWLVTPIGAFLVCLHGSLQHEALHGHPTRSALFNEALVFLPVSLWFPYRRYRALHVIHHNNDDLTDPARDPECRYFDPQRWAGVPGWLKPVYTANNSMLGRFILGPALSSVVFLRDEARLLLKGDREVIVGWALHAVGMAIVWWWVSLVCAMPFWQYVLLVAYWGNSLTMMRSYAEHRAHESVGCRTIVVETNPVIGFMFLNNNLHMAHHERPWLAWYDLPGYYRSHREQLLKDNCGYLMHGYGELARRWGLRPKEPVAHPLPHTVSAPRPR